VVPGTKPCQGRSGRSVIDMEQGSLPRGLLIGAIVASGAVALWFVLEWTEVGDPGEIAVLVAVVVAGYLAGVVAAVRRPTRRLGFGILIGLTLTIPALLILTVGVGMAIFCCQ
jgi:hypothetical protein